MFQTLKNAWHMTDLRKKILFSLLILLLYRIGSQIPVPFVSAAVSGSIAESSQGLMQYPKDSVRRMAGKRRKR